MRRFIEFFQGAERGVEGVKSRRGGEESRRINNRRWPSPNAGMQERKRGGKRASERVLASLSLRSPDLFAFFLCVETAVDAGTD